MPSCVPKGNRCDPTSIPASCARSAGRSGTEARPMREPWRQCEGIKECRRRLRCRHSILLLGTPDPEASPPRGATSSLIRCRGVKNVGSPLLVPKAGEVDIKVLREWIVCTAARCDFSKIALEGRFCKNRWLSTRSREGSEVMVPGPGDGPLRSKPTCRRVPTSCSEPASVR